MTTTTIHFPSGLHSTSVLRDLEDIPPSDDPTSFIVLPIVLSLYALKHMDMLTNSTTLKAVLLPATSKRSFCDMAIDELDDTWELPRKRWSGLGPQKPPLSFSGLRTPPSSGHGSKFFNASSLSLHETPSKIHQVKRPMSPTIPSTDRMAFRSSPTMFPATLKSESTSSYTPSLLSTTESSDEDVLQRTPPLSPARSIDEALFSARSTVSSTEVASEDEVLIRTRFSTRSISKTHAKETTQADLPLLGYRAFSNISHSFFSGHHFKAGLFQNSPDIPPCPAVHDAYYIAEAEKHVAKHPKPSPFISVTSTPLRALMVAFGFRRRKACTWSYLALIDLQMLRQAGTIQKAKALDLRPAVEYFPANEYLVWGEIKDDAIVSVIDIATLLNSPPNHPYDNDPLALTEISKHWKTPVARVVIRRVNRENQVFLSGCMGYAVGRFLRILRVPEYFWKPAVDGIVKDWGLASSRYERWQDNDVFCDFIRKGYNGTDISQSMPDSSSTMTVRTSEEEFDASPSQSPIITLSDDEEEYDEGSCRSALMQAVSPSELSVIVLSDDEEDEGDCRGALVQDSKEVTTDAYIDHPRYQKPQVNEASNALPGFYESQLEVDRQDERYRSSIQEDEEFVRLPKAYELEMAMSE